MSSGLLVIAVLRSSRPQRPAAGLAAASIGPSAGSSERPAAAARDQVHHGGVATEYRLAPDSMLEGRGDEVLQGTRVRGRASARRYWSDGRRHPLVFRRHGQRLRAHRQAARCRARGRGAGSRRPMPATGLTVRSGVHTGSARHGVSTTGTGVSRKGASLSGGRIGGSSARRAAPPP